MNFSHIFYKKNKGKKISDHFRKDYDLFIQSDISKRLTIKWEDIYPCLNDKTLVTEFDAHYLYHPAWAARIIKSLNPQKHIDISSTLHFCTILSAFIPTEFYDFRPVQLNLSSLITGKADLTNLFFESESIESLSCMHTIEHIGLGRYGDKIDPDGDLKAISELQRVIKKGGNLLLVTPVGKPRILFNAHRIYSFQLILDLFDNFILKEFSLVDDQGHFITNANPTKVENLSYGCGCFWFSKKM